MKKLNNNKSNYNDLGNPHAWKTIFKLALPAMLAQAIVVLYSIVDRIYVSNIPGEVGKLSLIGIGVCAPIGTLACSFAFLAGLGAAPLFSMSLGEKREDNAQKIMSHAFIMLLILGITTTIIFYSALTPILTTFGASNESLPYAKDYMIYYLIGNIFYTVCLGLNQLIIAEGASVIGMSTILIGCLLNIALDPLFIYTFGLGTKGAAIATIISQFCSFLFVMWYILFKSPVKLKLKGFKFEGIIIKKILKLGLTPWLVLASDSLTIIVLNTVLQKYGGANGDSYIAVATIVVAFLSLVTGPLLGISSGTQPALGYNFGAKNIDLIKKLEVNITILALAYCSIWFGLSFVVGEPFARMFASSGLGGGDDITINIVDVATKYIKIYSIGLIPLSLQYVLVDGLTGMGQARYSVWLSMFRKTLLIVLTITLPLMISQTNGDRNALSAFYAEPISDVISAIITTVIYLIITPKILEKQKNNTSKKDILYQ